MALSFSRRSQNCKIVNERLTLTKTNGSRSPELLKCIDKKNVEYSDVLDIPEILIKYGTLIQPTMNNLTTFPCCCIIGNSWPVLYKVSLTNAGQLLFSINIPYSQSTNANAELQRILGGVKQWSYNLYYKNIPMFTDVCTSNNVIGEIFIVKVSLINVNPYTEIKYLLVIHIFNIINLTSWPRAREQY